MNKDQIKGEWKQLKGKVKEKLGQVTNDDPKIIEGQREQVAGKIQKGYGDGKEKVEKAVDKAIGSIKK